MIIPIKKIILESNTMMSEQDKFSVVSGAVPTTMLGEHNQTLTKPGIHDVMQNRHKYGFASSDDASHLHNNHLTPGKIQQYQNDLSLIDKINKG